MGRTTMMQREARYVFLPRDVARRHERAVLVGFRLQSTCVVVLAERDCENLPRGMEYLGVIEDSSEESERSKVCSLELFDANDNRGSTSDAAPTSVLCLTYCAHHRRLHARLLQYFYTLVEFSPPNLNNMEFFSTRPILLQSTGAPNTQIGLSVPLPLPLPLALNDAVLDRINHCQQFRALLARKNRGGCGPVPGEVAGTNPKRPREKGDTGLLWLLNTPVRGVSLVGISAWCRQLDLRVRQFSHFPAQHRASTQPCASVEAAAAANSNYINLYNSLWLIVNDMVCGATVHALYRRMRPQVDAAVARALHHVLFARILLLVAWVGLHHPAGFKLNPELGLFLQGMFTWTVEAWRGAMAAAVHADMHHGAGAVFLMVLAHLGVSFLAAALQDATRVVLAHVWFINVATTHIYRRQLLVLRSLWQLFRGRKYNVLRHRTDSLDDADAGRVDRLLLGTVLITMLVYLLPTTFAFYALFAAVHMAVLTGCKLSDKLVVLFNLYPIFVVLLKLKNSRRLQGGVAFERCDSCGDSAFLCMENRPLTFDHILGNFAYVFRQEGRLVRLAQTLAEGSDLQVQSTTAMKFHYLTLPRKEVGAEA